MMKHWKWIAVIALGWLGAVPAWAQFSGVTEVSLVNVPNGNVMIGSTNNVVMELALSGNAQDSLQSFFVFNGASNSVNASGVSLNLWLGSSPTFSTGDTLVTNLPFYSPDNAWEASSNTSIILSENVSSGNYLFVTADILSNAGTDTAMQMYISATNVNDTVQFASGNTFPLSGSVTNSGAQTIVAATSTPTITFSPTVTSTPADTNTPTPTHTLPPTNTPVVPTNTPTVTPTITPSALSITGLTVEPVPGADDLVGSANNVVMELQAAGSDSLQQFSVFNGASNPVNPAAVSMNLWYGPTTIFSQATSIFNLPLDTSGSTTFWSSNAATATLNQLINGGYLFVTANILSSAVTGTELKIYISDANLSDAITFGGGEIFPAGGSVTNSAAQTIVAATPTPTLTFSPTMTLTPADTNTPVIGSPSSPTRTPTPSPAVTQTIPLTLSSNSFNPSSGNLTLRLKVAQAGPVKVLIFNIAGQKVVTLLDENLAAGSSSVTWNGRNDAGALVGNGLYFVVIQTSAGNAFQKVIVLR